MPRAAVVHPRSPGPAALDPGATVAAGTAVVPREGRQPQRGGALDVAPRSAVERIDDAFAVLGVKRAQQLRAAEHAGLRPRRRLDEQVGHPVRDGAIVDDAHGNPCVGNTARALLPPPAHDDDEIVLPDDRGGASVAGAAAGPD